MADPVVGIVNGVPTSGTGNITTLGQTLVDGANATIGITTGAAVTTSIAGTIQGYLRGIVSLLVSGITVASHAVTNAGTFAVQVSSTVSTAVTNAGTFAVQATLTAGALVLGKVGIDQTTDLTTNKVRAFIHDGTTALPILAASSGPPAATVPAIPVSIRDVNANLSDGSAQTTTGHAGAPVVGIDPYSQYETVAASASAQVMGATGAQYDYIAGVLIIPATTAAGAVSITDGNGSAITIFVGGGTTPLSDTRSFIVPLGLHALAGTTPGWKITTGTNVSAIGIGKFT